jgi:hypothetical protein
MRPACPGGSTGCARAPLRVPLESAPLRAGATCGLPGQASDSAETSTIISKTVDQFSMSSVDQFSMSLDTWTTAPANRGNADP